MTSKKESKDFVQTHFGNDNFRTFNVNIARKIGLEESIVLNDLIDFFSYLEDNSQLIKLKGHSGLWFYYDSTRCEKRTTLKEKALFRIVNNLKKQKLVKVVNAGVPQKRHFLINFSAVYKLSKKNSKLPKREDCSSQKERLDFPKGKTIKEPYDDPYDDPKEEDKSRNSVAPSEKAFGLASFLFEKIKELDPLSKKPNMQTWARDFDRMHNLDNRPWEQINEILEFAHEDTFWRTKILCPAKLRKQATQLLAQKNTVTKSKAETTEDRQKDNVKKAREIEKKHGLEQNVIRYWPDYLEVKMRVGENVYRERLSYSEHGFPEQLESLLRKGGWL